MDSPIFYALLSVVVISLISFSGALTLALRARALKTIIFILVSLSAGALFGDAFIHLIPEAFRSPTPHSFISSVILLGIVSFFVLEKFLHWRHSHGEHEETEELVTTHDHSKKHIGVMIIVGDAVHNLIDGVIIGASYLVSIEVGLATTLAVVLHEIPQEVGDFGLLLHAGFSKARALLYNFLSALVALVGVMLVFLIGLHVEKFVSVALAFAAGGFVYIAGSDLVPEIQKTKSLGKSLVQIASLCFGILLMALLLFLE